LKVESKYRHLDTFSDDPDKDAYVLYAFGFENYRIFQKMKFGLNADSLFRKSEREHGGLKSW